jgi:hypothetical protein
VSRGPGRIERAFAELLNSPPAADPHPDGLGPVGITVAEAAKLIFSTDQPTVSQKSTIHRVRLRLVERGEAIDILHGKVMITRFPEHWSFAARPIGRPRTPEEQATFDAYAEELHRKVGRILGPETTSAEDQGSLSTPIP